LNPYRVAQPFKEALEKSSPERRHKIGEAIADSGLAANAIDDLSGENREDTYNALCLLQVMAEAGEIQPLVKAIDEHDNVRVRRAAIKLLSLSGRPDVAAEAAKRRMMSGR
jgi:thioredoxin-like negative regulator of GroEL